MGSTINPRARGGASLSGELRASRDDRQQIRRLFHAPPKPKPDAPAPASGGGIVGMVQVNSEAGSVVMHAGQSGMDFEAVTYQGPTDPYGGAVGSWLSVSGYQLTLAPGWYNLTASVRLSWSDETSAPPSLSVYLQGGWDAAYNNACVFTRAALGSGANPGWGVEQVVTHGPTFIHDGDEVWLESRAGGAFPTADSGSGYVTWNVTKYG